MIITPTVLIIGAGASYPYGFPVARELKRLICEAFSNPNTTASRLLGNNSDYSADEFFGFREAFLKSGQPSVDAFLEHRPNFLGVGKLAIAYCLIPFEDEARLYNPNPTRGGDWYEYLVGKLNAPFDDFSKNQLSILTFNYDRSLEHYLVTVLQNAYGRSFEECRKALAAIPIIHVYGQLGKHPYLEENCHAYRPDNENYAAVAEAAAGITLLHEKAADLTEARKLLVAAKRLCFLGFSYHSLNIARLTFDVVSGGSKVIFGTAVGLIGGEIGSAQAQVQQTLGNRADLFDLDNLELLRKYSVLG